jgi:hypothetical protein
MKLSGDLASARKDVNTAAREYNEGVAIMDELIRAAPDDEGWRRIRKGMSEKLAAIRSATAEVQP